MIDECVAFDTKGYLYSYIKQQDEWRSSDHDLYVADIDVCEAGLTTCYGNCTCTYKGICKIIFIWLEKNNQNYLTLKIFNEICTDEKKANYTLHVLWSGYSFLDWLFFLFIFSGPGQAENGCPHGFGLLRKKEQQDFCYELYVIVNVSNFEQTLVCVVYH